MAEETNPETKKMVNPRVEIDTSPPFGSVEEAVTHFGGKGSWIPHHLLRLTRNHIEDYDFDKVEEQATQIEKDLLVKERETLGVLQELENTKKFVEGLKLKLVKDVSECMGTPDKIRPCPPPSPGLIQMELNQAKLNLNRSTNDLALIRSSVESLNDKMKKEKNPIRKPLEMQADLTHIVENKSDYKKLENILKELRVVNFEAEQFKNISEAAKYEMMKAMSEIEQTKNSINMVEMRLTAARKMEEAARAVEAITFAEIKANKKPNGVTLSFEEYSCLTQKAQLIEEISKRRLRMKRAEETTKEIVHGQSSKENDGKIEGKTIEQNGMRQYDQISMLKFKNSYPPCGNTDPQPLDGSDPNLVEEKTVPVMRSTISIGDILSRKLILQDDIVVGNNAQTNSERQQVTLSQMLRDQSGLILQPKKGLKEGIIRKQFVSQRKRFGFIDISLPLTRQSKKKPQASNLQ